MLGMLVCITQSCDTPSLPIVETNDVINITGTSAVSGGLILSDGGSTIMNRGVCWSTGSNPTIKDSKTNDGAGAGAFESQISLLNGSTRYYLRAYATNSDGTGYGMTMSFTTLPVIGQAHEGGIVFYLDASKVHGLACAPNDQITGIKWHNGVNVPIGTTSSSIGSGGNNTTDIVNKQGSGNYAAHICFNLTLNNKSDWYLPSINELDLMYKNLKLNGIGGFAAGHYWSSTESITNTNAWYIYFGDGGKVTAAKDYEYYVRAVRSF